MFKKVVWMSIISALFVVTGGMTISTWQMMNGVYRNEEDQSPEVLDAFEYQYPRCYQYASEWELREALGESFANAKYSTLQIKYQEDRTMNNLPTVELRGQLEVRGDKLRMRDSMKQLLEEERYIELHDVQMNFEESRMSVDLSLFNQGERSV